MNEYQLRRKLMEDGKTWEEAEDELNNKASDDYDRWRDEWDNNVRSKTMDQGEKMKGETK